MTIEKLLIKLVLILKANGLVINVFDQEFVSNSYMTIDYTEESTEYIKDCSESLFFKCWAEQIAETKEFNFCKRCVPVVYRSIMENIDHDIPECFNNSEEYCMLGVETFIIAQTLKSSCLKQCQSKSSRLAIRKVKAKPLWKHGEIQVDIYFTVLPEKISFKEYLVYDGVGMFGSIGGSLGLFVGFSIFDSLCPILEFLLKKLNFM